MSVKERHKRGSVGLQYLQQKRKRGLFLVLAVVLLLVTALISLFLGSNDVGFPNLLATCFPKLGERLSAEPMTNIQSMVIELLFQTVHSCHYPPSTKIKHAQQRTTAERTE